MFHFYPILLRYLRFIPMRRLSHFNIDTSDPSLTTLLHTARVQGVLPRPENCFKNHQYKNERDPPHGG